MTDDDETLTLLQDVPGGQAFIARCGGRPSFHDAEILSLQLCRDGDSRLVVALQGATSGKVTFQLGDCIDVSLSAFSQQNVIFDLKLRRAEHREIDPWEMGVGLVFGSIEIELLPCFCANGILRVDLLGIGFEPGKS